MPSRPSPTPLDTRRLAPRAVATAFVLGALAVAFDLTLYWGRGVPEHVGAAFDATTEGGLMSWLTVTLVGLFALTLWATAAVAARQGAPRARRAGWTALAVCVTYLAFDDATRLHERIGTAFAASAAPASGLAAHFPSYYWQLVLGPFFLLMGGFMLAFLWRALPSRRDRACVAAAVALLGVAVALDFVEGLSPLHSFSLYRGLSALGGVEVLTAPLLGRPAAETTLHLLMMLEETLELAAMALLWGVTLAHLTTLVPFLGLGEGAAVGARPSVRRRHTRHARLPARSPAPRPAAHAGV